MIPVATHIMRTFEDEKEIRSYVSGVFEDEIVFKKLLDFTEVNAKYSGLNCIVEHRGEEKYFVNLVDNDLKKVFNIQQYRKEDYELDGRKVLVYVINDMKKDLYEEVFQNYHHVEYLIADTKEILDYLTSIPPID